MSTVPSQEVTVRSQFRLPSLALLIKIGVGVSVLAAFVYTLSKPDVPTFEATSFVVRQGPMKITVVEEGSVKALEKQDIKSQVRGQTKILNIVEEGYQVTPEDVANGLVLVELDQSKHLEDLIQQEIQYQSAAASYEKARQEYGIQAKQNESDIKSAELLVKFGQMDFEKYVGSELGREILSKYVVLEPLSSEAVDLEFEAILNKVPEKVDCTPAPEGPAADTKISGKEDPSSSGGKGAVRPASNSDARSPKVVLAADGAPTPSVPPASQRGESPDSSSALETEPVANDSDNETAAVPVEVLTPEQKAKLEAREHLDFTKVAADPRLGGEAMQMRQTLQAKSKLAQEELKSSQNQLEGTRKLFERKFVTATDLEKDEMAVSRNEIEVQSAELAEKLFITYEFPKMAEKYLSDFEEAQRKLSRVRKEAVSKMAQAEAQLRSSEAQFNHNKQRRDDIKERIKNSTIRAERPGLVIYAGDEWRRQNQPIEKGAMINEQQEILTIPDMSRMSVDVRIPESSIKKIQRGQKAKIKIDAMPDEELTGEVIKVGVLPDATSRWTNPDVKLYIATVSIDGTHDWLKPEMNAEVEILIKELPNVIYVPLQAVSASEGQRVCYMSGGLTPERRVVETGETSLEFIEIRKGLAVGERVLLRAPEAVEREMEESKAKKKGEDSEGDTPEAPSEATTSASDEPVASAKPSEGGAASGA